MVHNLSHLAILNSFLLAELSFSDCLSWISRPDIIYLNSWLQTFYWYVFKHWALIGLPGIETFSTRTILVQYSLSSSVFQKVTTENLSFRTDLEDIVMDEWSVTQYMIVIYGSRLLKKSSSWKSKLVPTTVRTTQVTTWISNITFYLLCVLLTV